MATSPLLSYQDLLADSVSRRRIRTLLASGQLTRVARGWYTVGQPDLDVVTAIRAGGRLGCLSGCRHHGLWVPPHAGVHVVGGRGWNPAWAPGLVLHPGASAQTGLPVWPVADCVAQVAHRHGLEPGLIVAESAVHLGRLSLDDARAALAHTPRLDRGQLDWLAPAESGSETRVRLFLRQSRVPVRAQQFVPEVGRVDLLVGDSLIIECDSAAHHGETNYEADRRRDLRARNLGYDTLRLSYQQIWNEWKSTTASLYRIIRQRRHLRGPQICT